MAEIIWTKPAISDLDIIAEYIALDNQIAAMRLVKKVFNTIERLSDFPLSGKEIREMPNSIYKEIVVPPCRIFHRLDQNSVYILHVMRGEQLLHQFLLEERNNKRKVYL